MTNKLKILTMFLGVFLILLGVGSILFGIYGIVGLQNLTFIILQLFGFVFGMLGSVTIFLLTESD